MTAKLLAKLTPKGLQIEGAGGGVVEISQMDIAGSLGMGNLDPWAYKFSLGKWAGDERCLRESQKMLGNIVYARLTERGETLYLTRAHDVALLAMCQSVGGYHCGYCGGTGKNKRYAACRHCDGSGAGSMRIKVKAEHMGISKQAYVKTWEKRVKEAESVINDWEQQGLWHLVNQWREVA